MPSMPRSRSWSSERTLWWRAAVTISSMSIDATSAAMRRSSLSGLATATSSSRTWRPPARFETTAPKRSEAARLALELVNRVLIAGVISSELTVSRNSAASAAGSSPSSAPSIVDVRDREQRNEIERQERDCANATARSVRRKAEGRRFGHGDRRNDARPVGTTGSSSVGSGTPTICSPAAARTPSTGSSAAAVSPLTGSSAVGRASLATGSGTTADTARDRRRDARVLLTIGVAWVGSFTPTCSSTVSGAPAGGSSTGPTVASTDSTG